MITFVMLVTVWVGADVTKFNVWTTQRFNWDTACTRAMDNLADEIRLRAEGINGRVEIARQCVQLETRGI